MAYRVKRYDEFEKSRIEGSNAALVHRCGGSTLYAFHQFFALCFPFNRGHEHVREHQNSAILKAGRIKGKVYQRRDKGTVLGTCLLSGSLQLIVLGN